MSGLELFFDADEFKRAASRFAATQGNIPAATARALNRTGDMAKTRMVRTLTSQTGLKRRVIVEALKSPKRAAAGSLFFEIGSRGGDIRLKFFGPKETQAGVSATPWGHRQVFAGTFMKGGRFPNRHGGPYGGNGHVYIRQGSGRFPLKVARSGLYIPKEMVSGRTEEAFFAAVQAILPDRLSHELARALAG